MCLAEVVCNLLLQNVLGWFSAGWWFEIYIFLWLFKCKGIYGGAIYIHIWYVYIIYIYIHIFFVCLFVYFHPDPWGNDPIDLYDSYMFSNALVQPPTRVFCFPSRENTNMLWLWRLLNEWKLVVKIVFFVVVAFGRTPSNCLSQKTHPSNSQGIDDPCWDDRSPDDDPTPLVMGRCVHIRFYIQSSR